MPAPSHDWPRMQTRSPMMRGEDSKVAASPVVAVGVPTSFAEERKLLGAEESLQGRRQRRLVRGAAPSLSTHARRRARDSEVKHKVQPSAAAQNRSKLVSRRSAQKVSAGSGTVAEYVETFTIENWSRGAAW